MKSLQIGSESISFATSWAEASAQQIQNLLPLQLDLAQDPTQAAQLKLQAAQILLMDQKDLVDRLDMAQRWRLARLAGWVFTTRIQGKPFDHFAFGGQDYFLPDPDFSNTTSIEVAFANIQYLALGRKVNPDPNAVFLLVATLCRPIRADLSSWQKSAEFNGDSREAYNGYLAETRARAFQDLGLPIGIVMGVLQYFEWMNSRFLAAYEKAYEADPEETEAPLYTDGRGLITTFMDIAKTGVFGGFEAVCSTNAHTVWLYLVDNNLKIKQANRRAERLREDA